MLAAVALLVAACGGDELVVSTTAAAQPPATTATAGTAAEGCADVVGVTIEPGDAGFTVSATVASADTGWEKYADLWEVRAPDGSVLGERVLAHPHETEQPFTRSVGGVDIPPEIAEVVVAARDSVAGFCGAEFVAEVPHP
jgi:hypothetical protein